MICRCGLMQQVWIDAQDADALAAAAAQVDAMPLLVVTTEGLMPGVTTVPRFTRAYAFIMKGRRIVLDCGGSVAIDEHSELSVQT